MCPQALARLTVGLVGGGGSTLEVLLGETGVAVQPGSRAGSRGALGPEGGFILRWVVCLEPTEKSKAGAQEVSCAQALTVPSSFLPVCRCPLCSQWLAALRVQ